MLINFNDLYHICVFLKYKYALFKVLHLQNIIIFKINYIVINM